MVRTEKELLAALFGAMNGDVNPVETACDNVDIEKYRDADGFINVKNVKDINEIKKVFDIVDKKNYLEALKSDTNGIQELADALANEMKTFAGDDVVKVKIETPAGSACSKVDNKNNLKKTTFDVDALMAKYVHPTKTETPVDEPIKEVATQATENDVTPERMVVLYDVGGMYNPSFFNSVLYICEEIHFPDDAVYAEDELTDEDEVTTHVLLPNAWGKIFAGAADEFGALLESGDEVFIIDPESFELVQITNPVDLWDYAMTKVQEEML
jgi:hypothetical protein